MRKHAQPCTGADLCIPYAQCITQTVELQRTPEDRISPGALLFECTREGHLNGPASIEEITKEVVDLLHHQRLALVRLLLYLNQLGTSGEVESAWDEAIRARVKAVDEGRVVGILYEKINKEMADRFPS